MSVRCRYKIERPGDRLKAIAISIKSQYFEGAGSFRCSVLGQTAIGLRVWVTIIAYSLQRGNCPDRIIRKILLRILKSLFCDRFLC
ncbi:MAG: hypothetical protein D6728_00015 [Cyanobacteria bacterium J055]|nr:MAG: hypothetical protein D6728_00015 [Cyanobacteria bacterium J055]